jgi:hypothetical protein
LSADAAEGCERSVIQAGVFQPEADRDDDEFNRWLDAPAHPLTLVGREGVRDTGPIQR